MIPIATNEIIEQIFVEPHYETNVVLKNMNNTLNNHYQVLTFNNTLVLQGTLDIGNRYWHASSHNIDTVATKSVWTNRIIMFSEYCNDSGASVRVWKSVDKGVTWTNVFELAANNGISNSGVV